MQNPTSQGLLRLLGRLPKGLAGASFWLAVWFCLLFALRLVPGWAGTFFGIVQIFVGIALIAVGIPALWQLVRTRMLWSLRNKLVLTYLLIGLAPAVLFVTLVVISGYIAAGQFAIHLADSRLQAELALMEGENRHRADHIAQLLEGQLPLSSIEDERMEALDTMKLSTHHDTEVFIDGAPATVGPVVQGKTPLGLPPWATELPSGAFHDLVSDGGDLYLAAVQQQRLKDGRMLSLVTSLPVNTAVMNMMGSGLGVARLQPQSTEIVSRRDKAGQKKPATAIAPASVSERRWITGGTEPEPANVADVSVGFTSTEQLTDCEAMFSLRSTLVLPCSTISFLALRSAAL